MLSQLQHSVVSPAGGTMYSQSQQQQQQQQQLPSIVHSPPPPGRIIGPYGTLKQPVDLHVYRDLLVFEERLRQNLRKLRKKKHKYRLQLGLLVAVSLVLLYLVFYEPVGSGWSILAKLLFAPCVTVLYYAWSSRKYKQTTRFVPQCNRTLLNFNMHLDIDAQREGQLTFAPIVPRQLQDGFAAFKAMYFERRNRAKAAAAAAAAATSQSPSQDGSQDAAPAKHTTRKGSFSDSTHEGSAASATPSGRTSMSAGIRSRRPQQQQQQQQQHQPSPLA
ncbi:hypothetical protein GQ42DRAFT_64314 [Ramicandelaber brevisporus]|nr:hypothetical protein GQ42DRAFT_64314 [Ramicandelaber brevisporus]